MPGTPESKQAAQDFSQETPERKLAILTSTNESEDAKTRGLLFAQWQDTRTVAFINNLLPQLPNTLTPRQFFTITKNFNFQDENNASLHITEFRLHVLEPFPGVLTAQNLHEFLTLFGYWIKDEVIQANLTASDLIFEVLIPLTEKNKIIISSSFLKELVALFKLPAVVRSSQTDYKALYQYLEHEKTVLAANNDYIGQWIETLKNEYYPLRRTHSATSSVPDKPTDQIEMQALVMKAAPVILPIPKLWEGLTHISYQDLWENNAIKNATSAQKIEYCVSFFADKWSAKPPTIEVTSRLLEDTQNRPTIFPLDLNAAIEVLGPENASEFLNKLSLATLTQELESDLSLDNKKEKPLHQLLKSIKPYQGTAAYLPLLKAVLNSYRTTIRNLNEENNEYESRLTRWFGIKGCSKTEKQKGATYLDSKISGEKLVKNTFSLYTWWALHVGRLNLIRSALKTHGQLFAKAAMLN